MAQRRKSLEDIKAQANRLVTRLQSSPTDTRARIARVMNTTMRYINNINATKSQQRYGQEFIRQVNNGGATANKVETAIRITKQSNSRKYSRSTYMGAKGMGGRG